MEDQVSNEAQSNQSATPATNGYGQKGSWKKWLVIYLVIAVVVYAAIYYFWMRDTGTGTPLSY